jgi:O-antigen/teichoic acid export membrane protein
VGASTVTVLALAQFFSSSLGPTGTFVTMSGHSKINLVNSIILLSSNIVLNYILIPRYGLLGAAVATGASIVAVNVIRVIEIYCLLKFHLYDTSFIKPLFAGAVAFAVIFVSRYILGKTHIGIVIIEALGLIALYGAILYLLKLDKEDRLVINLIFKRLKGLIFPGNIGEGT